MINVEKLIRQLAEFKNAKVDQTLFEANYPVLFTMENGFKEFLFCCPVADENEMIWICLSVDPDVVIKLLSDEITIREAFTQSSDEKYIIKEDINGIKCERIETSFPEHLLPTKGEYMEAESGEFDDEIEYYSRKLRYSYWDIGIQTWNVYPLQHTAMVLKVPDSLWQSRKRMTVNTDWIDGGCYSNVTARIGG